MIDQSLLIEIHRRKFQDLHRRAAEAISQLTDDDVNWRPNEDSNSIANLIVHMAGNMAERLLSGIGGAPNTRDRDAEFNTRERYSKEQVLTALHDSFTATDAVLAQLRPDQLGATQVLRSREVTVLEVLFTVATHLSEHVGQILYIAKLRLGPDYRVLSIPHKKS